MNSFIFRNLGIFFSSFIIFISNLLYINHSQLPQWCNAEKLDLLSACWWCTYYMHNTKNLKYELLLYLVLHSILIVHAILIKSLWCKWKHKTSFYIAIPSSKRWWIVWVNSDRIDKICVFAWLAFKRTANDVVSRKRKETLNMQEGTKI